MNNIPRKIFILNVFSLLISLKLTIFLLSIFNPDQRTQQLRQFHLNPHQTYEYDRILTTYSDTNDK